VFPLLQVTCPSSRATCSGACGDFVVITDEAIQKECLEGRQMVWVVDITTETKPFGVSNFTVAESSGNFCARGGRFGTHSSNENMTPLYYQRLMFFAHFNAGVRVLDVRNPLCAEGSRVLHPGDDGEHGRARNPGRQRAAAAVHRRSRERRAIQTNNVEVDERGYIYIVDRANTGMHILGTDRPGARDRGLEQGSEMSAKLLA
jgi:hypothetical protein